jgi:flagella basal body P-ring formation protein FlgA
MNTVKTSTLECNTMQMLCRLLQVSSDRGLRLWIGCWLGMLLLSSLSSHAAPPVPAPQAVLQKSVVEWVAKEQAVLPDSVILAPLDPRMQVKACEKPLAMDLPFGSFEKLRVRCPQPAWQIYVRVAVQARQASKVPSPGPSAPSVSNAGTEVKASAAPEKRQVLVANMPLYKGQFLNESHVRLAEVESKGLNGQILESLTQVMHAELIRDVRPDAPLRSQDIRPTVLVKRGQMVLISVGQAQGFQISARVEAMQDGRFGDQIKLKNKESGRILTGQVKGPNLVEGL